VDNKETAVARCRLRFDLAKLNRSLTRLGVPLTMRSVLGDDRVIALKNHQDEVLTVTGKFLRLVLKQRNF